MSVGLRSEVLVWNLASGESRVLMPIPAANLGAMKVSPDGRTIAYRWTDTVDGKPVVTVRLMGTEPNAKPRVLSETPAHPAAWSMDGRSVLMLRGENAGPRSLEWMVVADESTRFIKTFESWQNPMTFAVSPDGSIAYSINPRTGSTEDRHIYVVDSAGQSETAVVNAAGLSNFPVWTADGAYLLFSSNKSGAPAVWSVGMRAGRPAGELSVLMPGAMRPVTATRGGAVYFATTNLASFNQLGFVADLEGGGARITKTFIGEGISWSPDGKSLAYIRNTNAPGAVMIRNVETGEERAYVQANVGLQQARWLPDSSGVVVFVRDPGARQSGHMYSLDLKSGEYRKLVQIAPGRSAVVALSPDGKSLYTSQKGTGTTELIAIELATGTERQVATFPNPSNAEVGLSISPDGSSLVVQTWADQANRLGRLLIARTDGSGRRDLLPSFPADRTLSILRWTSDGRSILYFTTAANGDWRLMRISPDGGQPEFAGLDSTRLTGTVRIPNPGPYSPLSMDASPDGTQIVFAYRPALRTELWSLDNVSSVIAARQ
jgi:Tol biopolymer transport system component